MADKYRADYKQLVNTKWKRTAKLLKQFYERYEWEANREDERVIL
jgi:hypothetical protein